MMLAGFTPLLSILILFQWHTKVKFYQLRANKSKLNATVVEYRYERIETKRNNYLYISYPYVRLDTNSSQLELVKLKYRGFPPLKKGATVQVFWMDQFVFLWNAYDRGLNHLLPGNWHFWKP